MEGRQYREILVIWKSSETTKMGLYYFVLVLHGFGK